jgi:hypothetical protein
MRVSLLILALLLVAVGQITALAQSAIEPTFKLYGFPAISGLTHLCQQNVYPTGNPGWHITWDAFASASTPAALVGEYRKKLGDAGFTKDQDGGTWRLPVSAPQVERVLQIMSSNTDSPHRSCARKPPAGSRSIILVSKKT